MRGARWLAVAGLASVITAGCASGGGSATTTTSTSTSDRASVSEVVELLPLGASGDARIVDAEDREVLLRGANLNSLGEYWQGDPTTDPTIAVTAADWDAMAEHGMSVVRLIISWSLLEPERGSIDEAYLDEVDAAVRAAADRGIYTVIDMHQDAYSAFISTDESDECPAGSTPGKGWDGAPEWATITDGLSDCVAGDRNSAPAVVAAWNHFYDNTDGIRDRFVASWVAVATRFAGRPEVAGYDLLNEPEVSRPAGELTPIYSELLAETITAIRAAEADADFDHLVFVEPAIPAGDPELGLVVPDAAALGGTPEGIVAAPHNYAESIDVGLDLTIEGMNDLFLSVASGLGVPLWIGEYGFWDTSEETLERVARFAADEDRRVIGGAWWQWRQSCGDPHSLPWGGTASEDVVHLNVLECPGNVDGGPNDAFLDILGRGYPRVAPGRIERLESDPESGDLVVEAGGAPVGRRFVVWTPTSGDTHGVDVSGVEDLETHDVPGGRLITGAVSAPDYRLVVQAR